MLLGRAEQQVKCATKGVGEQPLPQVDDDAMLLELGPGVDFRLRLDHAVAEGCDRAEHGFEKQGV